MLLRGVEGRTILSLAKNGFAIMTDSAQGGIKGYQAFGMMQGFWHCEAASDSSINFRATLVDFSYPDENDPDAKIGRVEISGKVETKTGSLKGQTAVKIFPLFADPFSGKSPSLLSPMTSRASESLSCRQTRASEQGLGGRSENCCASRPLDLLRAAGPQELQEGEYLLVDQAD